VTQLIVSLSSIPPRFGLIAPTLHSLLAQNTRADRVLLFIPRSYPRFPDWDGTLPAVPDGVEICRCDVDYGPATKVLAAVRMFRGQDCRILFCDDDRIYDRKLTSRTLRQAALHPGCCIAENGYHTERITGVPGQRDLQPRARRRWRILDVEFQLRFLWQDLRAGPARRTLREPARRVNWRSGHIDILEGSGGVLVQPDFFDDDAFDIPAELRSVDDVWLSGMMAKNGVPIWLQANIYEQGFSDAEPHAPLSLSVNEGVTQDTANRRAVAYMQDRYGIWP
jgi:hypothetical protein